ncbi:MAG: ammonium transporter [Candidatus Methanoperedens nitroreducens]|uniref:Ammonium transporter n=1 Tax=Candidatus Methanoperedens nitratireducens TaxID=1392998 RepID=A0A0P8DZD8_9EURY|nr:ammonium transporter [Candidatus Methanoperedens sp. BLZ2]KAB2947267.1 MAG: ammonium transporter [Candidatus Methanoperedens sp.]KPQ43236.1 MAG: ammonium transporter [Candidatus Methanoperedens sp. BLZ1]MBZ0175411.1 ammonium transporter [Candidatus Methanoperedens nitroreducens]MCX9079673.1 ammonium transporter [Candidatus Methanoperedens sp.]
MLNPAFNTTDITFIMIATILVMVMTPGLAFFYGGLVGRKNAITIMMQSFVALGVSTIMWVLVGYSLSFSGDYYGVIGNLDYALLSNISASTPSPVSPALPLYIFLAYQLMVAVITPPLITGAFTNRVRFKAYIVFLVLWQLLVYYPLVHMVWGGGALMQWGVKDFGGGIVVHAIAGMSALASVIYLGNRKVKDLPHSIPLIAIGMTILWFGWFGFTAGNAFAMNDVAVVAFLNTAIAGGFAAFIWMMMDWSMEGKPKLVGFLTGGLAGLVVITPAAGYITPGSSILFGIFAGTICYLAVMLKNRRKWDDALDVWGVHGIGGFLGITLLGVFSTLSVNNDGANGLLYGGIEFFKKEVAAVAFASLYAFLITILIFFIIDNTMSLRVSKDIEEQGLDKHLHGEKAYNK